jgi:site-specific recombinase XerC
MNSKTNPNSKIEELRPYWEKVQRIKEGLDTEKKKFLEDLEALIRRKPSSSAEDYAESLGLGRATLFWRLKQMGLSLEDVRKAVFYEVEIEKGQKIKKREIKALPPKDRNEFLQREVVQEVIKRMKAGGDKDNTIKSVISVWYNICKMYKVAPEDFTDNERIEEIRNIIIDYLNKIKDEGKDIQAKIASLQTLAKWLEKPILPSYIEQQEYKGKYQSAELPLELRELMINEIMKINNDIAKLTLRTWIFLFYTGSRAEALTNFTVEGEFKVIWRDFIDVFNEDIFIIVRTMEKGKKGQKFVWRKLIPKSWSKFIPQRNLTPKEVQKVRKLTRSILMKLMELYPQYFNSDTVKYIKNVKKVLHVWRHTFAREMLKAFKWNRYLVSKLGGWIKDSNLQIYGDYDLLSLIQVSSEQHRVEFCSEECKKRIEAFLSES